MMSTIWWEESISAPADQAWAALRRIEKTHELFAPVLVESVVKGDIRTVTFANGLIISERIVTIDELRRRLAYTVLGEMFEHHLASMQILPVDDANCRFVWISDFLPDERAEVVRPLVEQGAEAFARNLHGQIGIP
jgi:hypothetical protein